MPDAAHRLCARQEHVGRRLPLIFWNTPAPVARNGFVVLVGPELALPTLTLPATPAGPSCAKGSVTAAAAGARRSSVSLASLSGPTSLSPPVTCPWNPAKELIED